MPTLRHLVASANEEFVAAHNEGPYTSYKQIQLLLKIAGKSVKDLVESPTGVFESLTHQDILDVCGSAGPDVDVSWNGNAGRCTSISLKVVDRLNRRYPGEFHFGHFTVPRGKSGHRLSRCAKTGIVIDSLSNIGAFVLHEGQTKTIITINTLSWKIDRGELYLIDEKGEEELCQQVSHVGAQAACLYEISRSAQLVVLFRDMEPHLIDQHISQNRYRCAKLGHGVLKWKLKPDTVEDGMKVAGKKELILRPDSESGEKSRIVWSHANSVQDGEGAVKELNEFLRQHVGPLGKEQWASDEVSEFFQDIWHWLCFTYGRPKVMVSVMIK